MKTATAGRRLRQSELDHQYNASSALYGVDKTSHDHLSYAVDVGGPGTGHMAAAESAALRNNEYARMRLQQRLVGAQPAYHQHHRGNAVPYGPCRAAARPPPPAPQVNTAISRLKIQLTRSRTKKVR